MEKNIEIFSVPKVELTKQAEILLSELIPHPICVLSVQLTSLKLDYGTAVLNKIVLGFSFLLLRYHYEKLGKMI